MPVNPFKWKEIVSPGIAGLDDSKGAGPPATSIGGGAGGGGGGARGLSAATLLYFITYESVIVNTMYYFRWWHELDSGISPYPLRFIYLLPPMTSKVPCSLHFTHSELVIMINSVHDRRVTAHDIISWGRVNSCISGR